MTAPIRLRAGRRRRLGVAQALGLGAAATAVAVLSAGTLVTLTDPDVFPHLGIALWWAASTVTTVGYGDVVPFSAVGRVVAAVLMFGGVGGVALVTAIAASSVVVGEVEEEERELEDTEQLVLTRLDALERRMADIEDLLRALASRTG